MTDIADRLEELRAAGLYRRLRLVSGPQGPRVLLDGREVLLLCSNNYLGLADHPSVRRAAAEAAMRWGTGAGASRLVSGNMTLHRRLEERLADFHGTEAALLFGSGYLANAGTIAALVARRRGRVLGRAQPREHHRRVPALAGRDVRLPPRRPRPPRLGAEARRGPRLADRRPTASSRWTETSPRIPALVELARRHDCRLHGRRGARHRRDRARRPRRPSRRPGSSDEVDVIVGTLGKALGSYGAYVCASREITELLVNAARPVHLLDRAAAAVGRGGDRGAEADRRAPRARRPPAPQRRPDAPRARRLRARPGRVADPDHPADRRRRRGVPSRSASARSSAASSRRRSDPRPCPRAPRGCAHGDGDRTAPPSCATRRRSIGTAARDLGLGREAGRVGWEEPVPHAGPPEPDPIPLEGPAAPPAVGAPSLASQMPPGPLSIDLDEAA